MVDVEANPGVNESSAVKRALLAIQQLQAKIALLETEKHELIAIVGMGCRFPGANNPAEFWTLLQAGKETITEIPGDRWDVDQFYSEDPNLPGCMYTRHGGFVPYLYEFDAPFFRTSPREATSLDPQHRLLLEVSWEALENAGIAPDRLDGEVVGVFVGICSIDYWHQLLNRDVTQIDAYLTTGNTHSTASGRLSYLLGTSGPSLSVDAACASSLVSVHLACQSLRQRECRMAIAGGVNRILSPEVTINFCKAKMLSPDGRCKTFDATADGFVRSEGCGMVILKRLQDAIADRDTILAVILGSATNHDGRASGLTVPNGPAQQAVIRQALSNSRIEPAQVSYIEAHGTGTTLGDAIELEALHQVFGDRPMPLHLGSVKTNIGHLEAASGIAGLIKVMLALQHQTLPAHLHFQTPNPQLDWARSSFQIPIDSTPWDLTPWNQSRRIAGVSAFGFNGSNAHVVVAEAPALSASSPLELPLHLLTLSARSEAALGQLVERYIQHLRQHPTLNLADLCWTANTGRSHFAHRLAIVTHSLPDLLEKLVMFAQGKVMPDVLQGRSQQTIPAERQIVFTTGSDVLKTGLIGVTPQQASVKFQQLAEWYVLGDTLRWQEGDRPYFRRKVQLPTYPFQRQYYNGVDR